MSTPIAALPSLTPQQIRDAAARTSESPIARIARNAAGKSDIRSVALNRDRVQAVSHAYSHVVKSGKTTSQFSSGRCWLFAGLNLFRMTAAERLGLDDFELSQTYLMFWDKLEKSNLFLEQIIDNPQLEVGSRLLDWLCATPLNDGGQWDMFANLIDRYGVVPKRVMPETFSSSNSAVMNQHITQKLRREAQILRDRIHSGASTEETRANKDAIVDDIYRMLTIHLGVPPTSFEWKWVDKENKFHTDGEITPQHFKDRYCPLDLHDKACLIHCPQASKQIPAHYTVGFLGNVAGGREISYLNLPIETLKAAAVQMILDGKPVWFGCDVGKHLDRELGVLDLDLFDTELLYGTALLQEKAARLDYGQSLMTHAMVLVGVDLSPEGKPKQWRVENSWGEAVGEAGYLTMTDAWFDQYVYEVAVDKQYVSKDTLTLLETPATVLDPWDPMGSLAIAE
ncbi:MAG: C1 family peptidase [Armatimonadota bacterium]